MVRARRLRDGICYYHIVWCLHRQFENL